jgi:hypothetical protein
MVNILKCPQCGATAPSNTEYFHQVTTYPREMSTQAPVSEGDHKPILEISEDVVRAKLVEIGELSDHTPSRPLIAVDLDDVLCQTTKCAADCASVLTGDVPSVTPLIHRILQGTIARLGRTCNSRTSIVSQIYPLIMMVVIFTGLAQTRLGIKYQPIPV